MSEKIFHTIIIPSDLQGLRIDQALVKLLPNYSRTQIKTWIDQGCITINQKPIKAKEKVKGNETILIDAVQKQYKEHTPSEINLNIVYEDEDIIIINKPIHLVVHPGAGNSENTLLNGLIHHHPALMSLPRAGILHRLDKNTSGLLIIAKNAAAYKHLNHQLKKRLIKREYKAVVQGQLISGSTIDAPIGRHPLKRTHMAIVDTGKPAITHYRVLEKYRNHTLLRVMLETGRTHQIRVHMTHIRHPIVGDQTYGGRISLSKGMDEKLIALIRQFKRQALHAFSIGFTHPSTGVWVTFESQLPDDFLQLISALREDAKIK